MKLKFTSVGLFLLAASAFTACKSDSPAATTVQDDKANIQAALDSLSGNLKQLSNGSFFQAETQFLNIKDGAVLDGDWAEYRQGANEDLGIRVIISSAGAQPDTTVLGVGDVVLENDVILYQNYPNPAESITTVEFYVPSAASGAFNLYNTSGSLINTISFSSLTQGKHRVDINTAKLAAGIYYYTLSVKDKVYSKKMMVTR